MVSEKEYGQDIICTIYRTSYLSYKRAAKPHVRLRIRVQSYSDELLLLVY